MRQGARSENILHGSLSDEQRRRSGKDPQPFGLSSGGPAAALLLSRRTQKAMLLRRALPAAPPELSAPIAYLGDRFERGSAPLPASGLEPAQQVCSAC